MQPSLTRWEDATTPVEASAIPLPTIRELVIRARMRTRWVEAMRAWRHPGIPEMCVSRRKAAD